MRNVSYRIVSNIWHISFTFKCLGKRLFYAAYPVQLFHYLLLVVFMFCFFHLKTEMKNKRKRFNFELFSWVTFFGVELDNGGLCLISDDTPLHIIERS